MTPLEELVAESGFFGAEGDRLAFAHRGGSGLWPENTLKAFLGALELGCTHLETDVRMTADGKIVLMHDQELSRTTDGAGSVANSSWQELQQLDAAYGFQILPNVEFPERGCGHRILTLQELVEAAPNAYLNIEIKEWGPEGQKLPEALWQFIVDNSLQDRVLVAAEHHDLIVRFRQLSSGSVPTAASRRECLQFLACNFIGQASKRSWAFSALQIPSHLGFWRVARASVLRAAKAQGIAVHVWTIDEPDQMRELLNLGVDGLMTDYPNRLINVLSQYRNKL